WKGCGITFVIWQLRPWRRTASWADGLRRQRFISWLSGNSRDGVSVMESEAARLVVGQLGRDHPLARHFADFLTDMANAGGSAQTVRAYRGDLIQFAAHVDGEVSGLRADQIRAYLTEVSGLALSSRKRKRAAVASFCKWAVRHDHLAANPMDRIDTIKVPKTLP